MRIGLWAHLDDLAENCRGGKHDFLLLKKVLLLGATMGTRYQGVVQQCLGSDFVESTDSDGNKNDTEKKGGSSSMFQTVCSWDTFRVGWI